MIRFTFHIEKAMGAPQKHVSIQYIHVFFYTHILYIIQYLFLHVYIYIYIDMSISEYNYILNMLWWEGIIYDMMIRVLSFDFGVFFTIAASRYPLLQDRFKSCQQYLRRCAFKPKSGDCGVHVNQPKRSDGGVAIRHGTSHEYLNCLKPDLKTRSL